MQRGVSCLPLDDYGMRASQTRWGRTQPFRDLIAARVREENWGKRRGFMVLRKRGVDTDDGGESDLVVPRVAFLAEFGVFKHIEEFV